MKSTAAASPSFLFPEEEQEPAFDVDLESLCLMNR